VQHDSIGYDQATDIREDLNGNLMFIASDTGARGGAGALAIFNRSVGPFEAGRVDPGYLRSATFPDPAATGRVGAATRRRLPRPVRPARRPDPGGLRRDHRRSRRR
jgi:hypothetical protein